MIATPQSTITLYTGVDIIKDVQYHAFKDQAAKDAYFQPHILWNETPCLYVKDTGYIQIEADPTGVRGPRPADLVTCNYLSYINPNFENIRFYAFVTAVDYVNNETWRITWEADDITTWLDRVTWGDCDIVREHPSVADKTKIDANPWRDDLVCLKMPEPLSISEGSMHQWSETTNSHADPEGGHYAMQVSSLTWASSWRSAGALVLLTDINWDHADTGQSGTSRPSYKFTELLNWIVQDGGLSFYVLSPSMASALQAKYTTFTGFSGTGASWPQGIVPGRISKISQQPVTAIYFEQAASEPPEADPQYPNATNKWGELVSLLTSIDALGAVLGVYAIPDNLILFNGSDYSASIPVYYTQIPPAKPYASASKQPRNRKLCRFPYSFFQVITPTGDTKEIRSEEYKAMASWDGTGTRPDPYFAIMLDYITGVRLIVAPWAYRLRVESGTYDWDAYSADFLNSIEYNGFPQLAWASDAFAAQLTALSMGIAKKSTYEYTMERAERAIAKDALVMQTQGATGVMSAAGQAAGVVGSIFGAVQTGAKNLAAGVNSSIAAGSAAISGISAGGQAASAYINRRQQGMQANLMQAEEDKATAEWAHRYDVMGGNPAYMAAMYSGTEPAYALNVYHGGDGTGMAAFMGMMACDIVIRKATLRDDIADAFDAWFDRFGYAQRRFGLPLVVKYLQGATADADLPTWATVGGDEITYIQTDNARVWGAPGPICAAIKGVFNSGVRFIKTEVTI